MNQVIWDKLFPFYLKVDQDLTILSMGRSMNKLHPHFLYKRLDEVGHIIRPKIKHLNYQDLFNYQNHIYIFRTNENNNTFRGQIVTDSDTTIILCQSLWLTDIEQLKDKGLTLNDFALHDAITELLQLFKFQSLATKDLLKQTEELRRAKKIAEKASQTRQNFLSVMTHEIRTPLNAIIGISDFLIEEDPKPEQKEQLEILSFSANNLLLLVNDILDFSKIEAGKLQLVAEHADIKQLAKQIINTQLPAANEKEIDLLTDLDDSLPEMILIDKGRLSQILINLVGNAVKFTHQGYVKLRIKQIGLNENDQIHIRFMIEDTGIGIPEEQLKNILTPFTQADSSTSRKYGGTGLGLSITTKLLELFGSNLEVESIYGQGSTFSFNIEAKISHNLPIVSESTAHFSSFPENSQILVVEDNRINVQILTKYLDKWGLNYKVVYNGKEAIEIFQQYHFDLVLMDLLMPIMDGYNATKGIRELPTENASRVPIIALSASLFSEVRTDIIKSGMNDFLNKPFKKTDLKNLIAKYLLASEIQQK